MRIGYLIDTFSPGENRDEVARSLDAMIEEAQLAEQAGFHSVTVPDRHHSPLTRFAGAASLLTLLARETRRVAIGSYTHVATLTHPMQAAEQFSVIDNLSRGRLFTTLSRGFVPDYWGQFGVPAERMLGRFQEALAIWRRAMTGERFSYDGEFWQVRDGRLRPAPYQPGGWPVWGGGNVSPAAARRCADYADCWTSDPMPITDDAWRERADAYRDHARELGKAPFVVAMRDGWIADSFEQAARDFGEHIVRPVRFYVRHGQLGHPGFTTADDVSPQTLAPHLVLGTAQQCIERLLTAERERGIDYVMMCLRVSTGPDFARVREQILRFGEEVVRPIHARSPAPDHAAIPLACRV